MSNWTQKILEYLSNNYAITNENIKNIKELTLNGQFIGEISPEIKKYLEKFINVEKLNLAYCKLHSLENLPNLPNVSKIELSDNYLDENEFIKLQKYPLLSEIYFENNKVNNYDILKNMSSMRDLHLIDLSDNPICKDKEYRKNIFEIFPKLIFLDGLGKNNNEAYEDFEDNEEESEEEEENEEDKNFLDDEYEEIGNANIEEEEEEEEENEENKEGNYINDTNNNHEINEEEEEEEIENPHLAKRKKYK